MQGSSRSFRLVGRRPGWQQQSIHPAAAHVEWTRGSVSPFFNIVCGCGSCSLPLTRAVAQMDAMLTSLGRLRFKKQVLAMGVVLAGFAVLQSRLWPWHKTLRWRRSCVAAVVPPPGRTRRQRQGGGQAHISRGARRVPPVLASVTPVPAAHGGRPQCPVSTMSQLATWPPAMTTMRTITPPP